MDEPVAQVLINGLIAEVGFSTKMDHWLQLIAILRPVLIFFSVSRERVMTDVALKLLKAALLIGAAAPKIAAQLAVCWGSELSEP